MTQPFNNTNQRDSSKSSFRGQPFENKNQPDSSRTSLSSCIVEEKYQVAKIIETSSDFSVFYINAARESCQMRDAVYAVIGELLDSELIKDTGEWTYTLNGCAKIYQIEREKHEDFVRYVEELNSKRVQPNKQGKPRGFNFRIAESLVEQLTKLHEKMEQSAKLPQRVGTEDKRKMEEEKDSLLDSLTTYLGAAQEDEIPQQSSEQNQTETNESQKDNIPRSIRDRNQAKISEAHIRKLYGELLVAKGEWSSAIMQLLIARRIFSNNELQDNQSVVESRACQILIDKYNGIKQDTSKESITKLIEFAQQTETVVDKAIQAECKFPLFAFVSRQILKEIEQTVEYLSRRKPSEFLNALNRKWTLAGKHENPILASIYSCLNEARLLIMDSGNYQETNRLSARRSLEEARSILQTNKKQIAEEAQTIQADIDKHLEALHLWFELNQIGKSQEPVKVVNFNFDGLLPFYLADVLNQAMSLFNSLLTEKEQPEQQSESEERSEKQDLSSLESVVEPRHSVTEGDATEDYAPEDIQDFETRSKLPRFDNRRLSTSRSSKQNSVDITGGYTGEDMKNLLERRRINSSIKSNLSNNERSKTTYIEQSTLRGDREQQIPTSKDKNGGKQVNPCEIVAWNSQPNASDNFFVLVKNINENQLKPDIMFTEPSQPRPLPESKKEVINAAR